MCQNVKKEDIVCNRGLLSVEKSSVESSELCLEEPLSVKNQCRRENYPKAERSEGKFDFCLPGSLKPGRAEPKVDKNRWKCLIFVYQTLRKRSARLRK